MALLLTDSTVSWGFAKIVLWIVDCYFSPAVPALVTSFFAVSGDTLLQQNLFEINRMIISILNSQIWKDRSSWQDIDPLPSERTCNGYLKRGKATFRLTDLSAQLVVTGIWRGGMSITTPFRLTWANSGNEILVVSFLNTRVEPGWTHITGLWAMWRHRERN